MQQQQKQDLDYKKLSQEIFEAQNEIRQNPQSFIPKLQERLKYFKGNTLYLPNQIGLVTQEGPQAVEECIKYLQKAKPQSKLTLNQSMSQACQDHVNDLGPQGMIGHVGSQGSTLNSRLENYGKWESTVGENMSCGASNGIDVIVQLIIDDGVKSRGHRENIFNNQFKITGIAAGYHKIYKTCAVLDYAGNFIEGFQQKQQSQNYQQQQNTNQNQNFMGQFQQFQQQQQYQQQQQQFMQQPHNIQQDDNEKKPIGTQTQQQTKINNNIKTTTTTTTYTYADGTSKTVTKTEKSTI